jgi:preprotein translocase subunit SecG
MNKILSIIQIIIAVLLVTAVLIQNKGVGLSQTFGGEGNVYRAKRGAEKTIFIITVILSTAFLGLALANLFI